MGVNCKVVRNEIEIQSVQLGLEDLILMQSQIVVFYFPL